MSDWSMWGWVCVELWLAVLVFCRSRTVNVDCRIRLFRHFIREVCFGVRWQMRIVFSERQTDENCKKVFERLARFSRDSRRKFVPVISLKVFTFRLIKRSVQVSPIHILRVLDTIFSRCHRSDGQRKFQGKLRSTDRLCLLLSNRDEKKCTSFCVHVLVLANYSISFSAQVFNHKVSVDLRSSLLNLIWMLSLWLRSSFVNWKSINSTLTDV